MNVEELHEVFKNHPEGQWIISLEDAEELDKILSRIRPASILELGTGIGAATAVLAKYGKVQSVEQYQKCIDIAGELIPTELPSKSSGLSSMPTPPEKRFEVVTHSVPVITVHREDRDCTMVLTSSQQRDSK